jgi:hypothetical protein
MAILNEDFESGKGKALQDKISSQHEQSFIPAESEQHHQQEPSNYTKSKQNRYLAI